MIYTIGYDQNTLAGRSNDKATSGGVNMGEALYTSRPFVKQLQGSHLLDEWMKTVVMLKSMSKIFSTDNLKYDESNVFFDDVDGLPPQAYILSILNTPVPSLCYNVNFKLYE